MAMTTCKECSAAVAVEAPACPGCGIGSPGDGWEQREARKAAASAKASRQVGLGCGGLVLAVLAITLIASFSGDEEPDLPSASTAEFFCEDFVRDRLRSPSTADFTGTTAVGGPVTWSVRGAVDAQNGFGAAIRSSFTCQLRYDSAEESWTLVSLTGLDR